MTINFCHIAPTQYILPFTGNHRSHMILAHMVEQDDEYANTFNKLNSLHRLKIMDNSAFEMYKQNKPMMDPDKLISLAQKCDATHVVMSDYPTEPAFMTINAAKEMIPQLKRANLKTVFVPQSQIGDIEELIACTAWGLSHPDIDLVGISILAVPNAYGVERDNKLQRFLSRWKFLNLLRDRKLLQGQGNKLHMLGMVDGPHEIALLKDFHRCIYSWDSSAAVWCGINGIKFDHSPTGLIKGKYEEEVAFDLKNQSDDLELRNNIDYNINYIDRLCK